uniref:Uncharacterized protein n=1 Tax=Anguilla anguilla TaxID=7936 RepID=A0A0E9WEU9_ANGAN
MKMCNCQGKKLFFQTKICVIGTVQLVPSYTLKKRAELMHIVHSGKGCI